MKSMNSGTPASVALPERSSLGMIRSTSTRTVSHSWAVNCFGSYVVPRASASRARADASRDRKSTRLNSSHLVISYAVFCLKKNKQKESTARVASIMVNTNLSKQQQVSEIMRQLLTHAHTAGQYFTHDYIKYMYRRYLAAVAL